MITTTIVVCLVGTVMLECYECNVPTDGSRIAKELYVYQSPMDGDTTTRMKIDKGLYTPACWVNYFRDGEVVDVDINVKVDPKDDSVGDDPIGDLIDPPEARVAPGHVK